MDYCDLIRHNCNFDWWICSAVFILGKGTKTSVGKYFSDPKNLPMLYLLSLKYLTKVEEPLEHIHKPNSIEGLSEELRQDSEVVSLMSIVTNALFWSCVFSEQCVGTAVGLQEETQC